MTAPLTIDQLLLIVDRAERGVILAQEAQQLRDGVRSLMAAMDRLDRMATAWELRLPDQISTATATYCIHNITGPFVPAQRPAAATGSGAATPTGSGADAPSRSTVGP